MYDDRRTIQESGLLSPRQRTYTPGLISMNLGNPSNKPDPGHINIDKDKALADYRYEQQLAIGQQQFQQSQQQSAAQFQQQQASAGDGGGMSIICTRCHELGLMSDEIYAADEKYGAFVREYHPDFMEWYLEHASPIVELMHYETIPSKVFTKLFWLFFVAPWSNQMAFESNGIGNGNKYGKWLMNIGYWAFKHSIGRFSVKC